MVDTLIDALLAISRVTSIRVEMLNKRHIPPDDMQVLQKILATYLATYKEYIYILTK